MMGIISYLCTPGSRVFFFSVDENGENIKCHILYQIGRIDVRSYHYPSLEKSDVRDRLSL